MPHQPLSDRLLTFDVPRQTFAAPAPPAPGAGPLTVSGLIVPFGETVTRLGVPFTFERGSLRLRGTPADVKLLVQHDDDRPVGYATELTETDDGWLATFALPDVPSSQAAYEEATALLRDGLSVGVAMSETFADEFLDAAWSMRELAQPLVFDGELLETSLVTVPQFNRARVTPATAPAPAAVAAAAPVTVTMSREAPPMPDTLTPPAPTLDVDAVTARLDQIEARLVDAVREPDPRRPDVRAAFADLVTRFGADRSASRLVFADMVSGTNPGLTSTERTTQELIDYLDTERYLISHVASMPFPETGVTHTLPRKTQNTQVGAGSGEKTEAPSRPVTTDTVQFTGDWYKGWLDISYELIRTSSPGAVAVAVDDMLGQAALHSEQTFVSRVEAAATAAGAPIDFSSYGTFIKSVRAAVRTIRAAAGKGAAPKFALTPDSWDELLAFVDATDRRLLSTVGASNADGSASLTADTVSLGGLMFFESPHSTVDLGFNDNSLRVSELPPMQLAADNPQLVGRDVAVLGNIMAVPRVPAGIVKFAPAAAAARRASK